jgi:hypothetical protein
VAGSFLEIDSDVQEDDLDKIRDSVLDLRKLVERSDISPTLKKGILELIRATEDAISRYKIHGARGLKRAYKHMLGEVADLYGHASKEEKEQSGVWNALTKHLALVDRAASTAMKCKSIAEWTWKLFRIAADGDGQQDMSSLPPPE